MQDRYAGDIGDFGKFALLRALAPGRRLGICWCRTDGAGESNNDGRHLGYLQKPDRFRKLDSRVFDALEAFVGDFRAKRCARSVESLEALGLLRANTRFHGEICPGRAAAREEWALGMVQSMAGTDLVFLDPDNGLEGSRVSRKSTAMAELLSLRQPGRTLLLYHHQTRCPGGAAVEAALIAGRLSAAGFARVDAVRLRPYSSRFYFLIDADAALRNRLLEFGDRWGKEAELRPSLV